jgi:ornithine cyclodeaminase/alanine dehydrogenase-like protein (mu-crystallin family)
VASRPLRYLSADDVDRCLPPLATQLELARTALATLASGDAEMPPKIGVHPRPGALLHAMPAWLRTADLVGLKWVSAFPGNSGRGAPAIQGLIVLNDPETGTPLCVMDGAHITAARTAAVSGVALGLYAPDGARRVAILGAGVQARSHLPVLTETLGTVAVNVFDRHGDRARTFAEWAARQPDVATAHVVDSARDAACDAHVVITAGAISKAQEMTADWLGPGVLTVAVDFATYVSAELAKAAGTFAVDDRAQFLAYRDAGYFERYPEPTETLGDALKRGRDPARDGHVVVTHLGVGTSDILFANYALRTAEERGIGSILPR